MKHIFFVLLLWFSELRPDAADCVIFSYDRPLQLYALLESFEEYVHGLGQVHVVYRASSANYAQAYEQVTSRFAHVQFHKQGDNPKQDFKILTEQCAFNSPNQHLLFAVDDNIVKDHINIDECIAYLEKMKAYGFYLRMGKNLTDCYTMRCKQPLPPLTLVEQDIFSWRFCDGICDWVYPHTVDMTLYRKNDVAAIIQKLSYDTPNSLEAQWALYYRNVSSQSGLCYGTSKIFNIPLNCVQTQFNNRHMQTMPIHALLTVFQAGSKLERVALAGIINTSAHMEYEPTFIKR